MEKVVEPTIKSTHTNTRAPELIFVVKIWENDSLIKYRSN